MSGFRVPVSCDTVGLIRSDATFLGHPKGMAYLAFAEAWERFSFYGMQALLGLYMVGALLQPETITHVAGLPALRTILEMQAGPMSNQAVASAIFGLFAGAIYLTPILGGLLADRFLGRRRTVILGACLMAAGHFMMAFEWPFLLALVLLVIGAGCFKGNIASQVSALYEPGDQRRADAFQIFYLCINSGAICAPLVCGTLGELAGWSYGFGAAGVGMVIGLVVYLTGRKYLPSETGRAAPATAAYSDMTGPEKARLAMLVAMLPVFSLGLVTNQQVGNAYLIWAKARVDLSVAQHAVPVTWLLTLESIATVICLPGSALFWRRWAKRRPEPDEMTKIVIGCAFLSAAPAVLMIASYMAAKVSMLWLFAFAFLNEIGFANVLPVALALYTRATPRQLSSTIVGIYYLQLVVANILTGYVGGLLGKLSSELFWALHAVLAGTSMLVFLLIRFFARGLLASQAAPDCPPEAPSQSQD
jgi:POT family proton-dependent oligopeptide transporter